MNETTLPPQQQTRQPGQESDMRPQPEFVMANYRSANRLHGKVALISGGDFGNWPCRGNRFCEGRRGRRNRLSG